MSGRAYHFVGDTLRDGRPVPADGEWLEHDGPIVICAFGLHASRRPWHALTYAPGPVLCLVEVDQVSEEWEDKLVARRRRIVRRADLTADLRAFARQCARDVLHLWDAPDVVRRYLETGDDSLRAAAYDAAGAAAWEAGRAAAWSAAWATAREAAMAAAMAARDAAMAAAREAARAVAWNAAGGAAWNAARTAARDAAWNAYGERFDALCAARLGVRL